MKPLPSYLQSSKKKSDFAGQKGFTLVEIIAVLVITGILAVLISTGVVRIIEGYFFTRDNTAAAMKAQVAVIKISKELRSIEKINSGKKRSMSYSYNRNGKTIADRSLFWSGTALAPLMLGKNILLENVTDFEITFHEDYQDSGSNTWSQNKKIIGISFSLKGASDHVSPFSTMIVPRNL